MACHADGEVGSALRGERKVTRCLPAIYLHGIVQRIYLPCRAHVVATGRKRARGTPRLAAMSYMYLSAQREIGLDHAKFDLLLLPYLPKKGSGGGGLP